MMKIEFKHDGGFPGSVVPTVLGAETPEEAKQFFKDWAKGTRPVRTAAEFIPDRWGYGLGGYGEGRAILKSGREIGFNISDEY